MVTIYDIQTSEGYWSADFYPDERATIFTGRWWMIPDMLSKKAPSEKRLAEWTSKFRMRENYLNLCVDEGLFTGPKSSNKERKEALLRVKEKHQRDMLNWKWCRDD